MREIKFRGYSPKEGRWSYGDLLTMYADIEGTFISDRQDGIIYRVRADTVGQYTGLKDKNGKEIYEGDIVEVKDKRYELHGIGIVEWDRENGLWAVYFPDTQGATMLRDWLPKEYEASLSTEVIGNIYENPELLEEVGNETS